VVGLLLAATPVLALRSPALDPCMYALDPTLTSMITGTGAGYAYAYRIAVANAGPDSATNIVTTLTLPAGASFTGSLPLGDCTASGTSVSCSFGSLVSTGGAAKVVRVTAPAAPGTATAVATASSNETDPNSSNDSATVSLTIVAAHDLDITKS